MFQAIKTIVSANAAASIAAEAPTCDEKDRRQATSSVHPLLALPRIVNARFAIEGLLKSFSLAEPTESKSCGNELDSLVNSCNDQVVCDILCLFDEANNRWVENAPTVLRLEETDLVICTNKAGAATLLAGSIDSEADVQSFSALSFDDDGHINCVEPKIQWRSYHAFTRAIGTRVSNVHVSAGGLDVLCGGNLKLHLAPLCASNNCTRRAAAA